MAWVLKRWWWVSLGVGLGFSCGRSTPLPVMGSHTEKGDEFLQVPKPPEPVRVGVLGEAPTREAVWIDGYWHWSGRRWVWREGVWAIQPEGAYYAGPELVRIPIPVYSDGGDRELEGYGMTLLYRPGHWHLADGGIAPVEAHEGVDAGP